MLNVVQLMMIKKGNLLCLRNGKKGGGEVKLWQRRRRQWNVGDWKRAERGMQNVVTVYGK